MRGRPSKLTPEVHDKIVAAIAAGNTREASAAHAGVSPRTVRAWLQKGEKARNGSPCKALSAAVKDAENVAEIESVAIIRLAARKNWTAAAWWLERRRPEQWGRKDALEVTFRREAERIAKEVGLSVDEVIAEAERIVSKR